MALTLTPLALQHAADHPWHLVVVTLNGTPARTRVAQRVALARIAEVHQLDVVVLDEPGDTTNIAMVFFADRNDAGRDPLWGARVLAVSRTTHCELV
jgi:hypothetical protein